MEYIIKIRGTTDWRSVTKSIDKQNVNIGDELIINGYKWRILDVQADRILIWKFTGVEDHVFNENGSNTYDGSHIQRFLQDEFKRDLPDEMLQMVGPEGFFLLTMDQVMQYMPTEMDRIAADADGCTTWWWTASPSVGNGGNVRYVYSDGIINYNHAINSFGVAPACWLINNPE